MGLEERVKAIEERNRTVEAEKAWETSKTRRFILAAATYLVVLYFLVLIGAADPHLVALVPAGAYIIQQYSMPFIKKIWASKIRGS